jgi:hypothetical protein
VATPLHHSNFFGWARSALGQLDNSLANLLRNKAAGLIWPMVVSMVWARTRHATGE